MQSTKPPLTRSSKAQMELQFNWIFVLIVGAVILLFFFTIIGGQSKTSEQTISINFAQRMKTILSATEQQPGTIKIYERIPPFELSFVCNTQENLYYYAIEDIKMVNTKYNIYFSPYNLQGDVIYTWTKSWSPTYSVGNFLYVTNDKEHFVFYQPDQYSHMNDLYKDFPENFSRYAWNKSEEDIKLNMDRYTYVFLKQQLNTNSEIELNFKNADLDARGNVLVIEPANNADPFFNGTIYFIPLSIIKQQTVNSTKKLVNFLTDSDNAYPSPYLDKASIYGAMFSESKQTYACTMQKALQRLRMASMLHYYRIKEITSLTPAFVSASCTYLLDNTVDTGATHYLQELNKTLQESFNFTTIARTTNSLNKLATINNQVTASQNCLSLY
ncbi:hypothetical protein K9M74_02535 [Candidatus Woesearchaeota archaeon]|nr:hypothetical protein [Candidatus Woesearchaeota archaeon]